MKLIYAPEGGERQEWDLREVRFLASEAAAVERVTGMTWVKVQQLAADGGIEALRAMTWCLVKRTDTTKRYSEFDPSTHEIGVGYDAEERAEIRKNIETSSELSDDEREAWLAQLDKAEADLAEGEDEAPKVSEADSTNSESATGS